MLNHIDTDEVHRSTTAEIIGLVKRDSSKDPNRLAVDKYKDETTIYFCEPEKVGERPGYQSRNLKNGNIKGEGGILHPRQDTG
eukprot:14976475-Heterocapsa_arctica.AAC.2